MKRLFYIILSVLWIGWGISGCKSTSGVSSNLGYGYGDSITEMKDTVEGNLIENVELKGLELRTDSCVQLLYAQDSTMIIEVEMMDLSNDTAEFHTGPNAVVSVFYVKTEKTNTFSIELPPADWLVGLLPGPKDDLIYCVTTSGSGGYTDVTEFNLSTMKPERTILDDVDYTGYAVWRTKQGFFFKRGNWDEGRWTEEYDFDGKLLWTTRKKTDNEVDY